MRLTVMYGLQLLDLPTDTRFLRALLSPRDIDLGKLYLGVSLTIIISFMTYYAITLSLELYRTIASSLTLFHPAKPESSSLDGARIPSTLKQETGSQSIAVAQAASDISPLLEPSALANSESVFRDRDNTSTPLHPDEPIPLMVNPAQTSEDDTELSVSAEFARPHHSVEIQPAMANGDPPAISQEEGASHSANSIPIGQENIVSCTVPIIEHVDPLCDTSCPSASRTSQEIETSYQPTRTVLLLPATASATSLALGGDSLQASGAEATYLPALNDDICLSSGPVEVNAAEECSPALVDLTQGGVEEADGEMALNLVSNTASVLLQNPSDVSGHQRFPEQTETNERMTLGDFIDVSTSLMESAILVEEVASDSEQRDLDPDADCEAGWTTVSCDDYGAQGEPSGPLDSVLQHALDEGSSKDVPPTYRSVELSAVLVTPSDDLQHNTRTCEVLLATPKPASTLNATSATLPHDLVLPKTPNQQLSTMSQTSESEDSASIYIGPLTPKPMSARVHTEEKPDWAVAPNVRAKPRRSVKGSGPGNAAVDRQKGGRSRKAVTAKARSQVAVPARSQGDVAQTTTQAGDREATRRRSARLNPA